MSTKTQRVLNLVKVKSWYIPGDAEAYQMLKAASLTMLIFHKDFLPTLDLVFKQKQIATTPWSAVYQERVDAIAHKWKAKKGRDCRVRESKLTFTCTAGEANRKAINNLDTSLSKFFARWSFSYISTFSEDNGKYKLVVEFSFNPNKGPVVPVVMEDLKSEYELVLGFTKLKITIYDKQTNAMKAKGQLAPLGVLETFTQTGSDWLLTGSSTFIPHQGIDVANFLTCLCTLHTRNKN